MSSLSHRLTMTADVHRDADKSWGKGSETLTEKPHLQSLPCFVTVEMGNRQRQSTIDLDTGVTYYVMLVEPGTDIKVEDNVLKVRDAHDELYLAGPVDVVAVLPHRGFGPHTTNLTEIHLRSIGS